MSDAPASARALAPWTLIFSGGGTVIAIGTAVMSFGGRLQKVDELDRRLTKVEQIQQTNLPVFYAMNRDLAYLAERARREDERLERPERNR